MFCPQFFPLFVMPRMFSLAPAGVPAFIIASCIVVLGSVTVVAGDGKGALRRWEAMGEVHYGDGRRWKRGIMAVGGDGRNALW